ncbi:MAG: STAS domain-containing protein [Gemmatimonadota bacterium]|nr:STAS domain-containing protein [Gemmatimonadota bacterium]MDE2872260.1 STAS domain-containing protein [Gemmatimonadota bacterium]
MSLTQRIAGRTVVFEVDGQLIVGNRHELKRRMLAALADGTRGFVIDFSRTEYIDSSGLGALVSLSKEVRAEGGELRLASLDEDLRTLFELTGLDTFFRISDDAEEARRTITTNTPS